MRTWILFSLLLLSLTGCLQGYDYTIDYRNRFFERLKSFEHKRSQMRNSFVLIFEVIQLKLQSPKPNFRNIAWEWDSRLSTLKHRIDDLQEDLVKMDTLANFFYRQLKDINKKMTDKTVREREKLVNQAHEKQWRDLRELAKRNMTRARNALKLGHDAHKVLISSGIRTKRETAIKTMNEVRGALFHAARRLEHFANSSELLVSLESEDLIPNQIKKMEERRQEVVNKLDFIAKKMERNLQDKNVTLQEISWQWESKYADMRYDLEALADEFDNVKAHTQVFYDKSAYHIAQILTPTIREKEINAQKIHQTRLDSLYSKINDIKVVVTENLRFGDDAYQVLINAARRKKTTEALEQLDTIGKKLRNALIEFRDINTELKAIFNGQKKGKFKDKLPKVIS